MTTLTRSKMLGRLYDKYRRDPNFEHLRYRSRFVPGIGSLGNAKLHLVGEAPTDNDTKRLIPFANNRIINDLITDLGLERPDVFMTHIVKYRPPGGRPPSLYELHYSQHYIWEELAVTRATVIVTFGAQATFLLAPRTELDRNHGHPVHITSAMNHGRGIYLVPLSVPVPDNRERIRHCAEPIRQLVEKAGEW